MLEPLGCEVAIEVYIEAPRTPEGVAEIKLLQEQIPHAVMLVDTEMLWTWQQMATADVVVMSNSMFSMSAALMNPQAVCIHVPYRHYSTRVGMFRLAHWYTPLDENGTLPSALADDLERRVGLGSNNDKPTAASRLDDDKGSVVGSSPMKMMPVTTRM